MLLIDEVLAVGDEAFQRKCLRRISEQIAAGTTIVLVSHDPTAIERVCERVVVLEAGHVVFDGPTAEGLLHYHRLMGTEHHGGESVRPTGRRAVEVADVELQDELGRVSSVFRSGQPMHIQVELRAGSAIAEAGLRLEVRLDNGTQIFATTSPAELNAEGSARLAFEIADLPLLGGDYDLVLGAAPMTEEPLPERTVRFSVAHSEPHAGVVDLRGAWRSPAGAGELS